MSPVGLNSGLQKHHLTANHMLMEQMAGSEMKPPFSSWKNKIN